VRIIGESERFPGTGILLHTRIPRGLRQRITEVLVSMPDREDGKAVLQRMDYSGYQASTAEAYERFRVLLPEARRHLEPAQSSP
jgi:ABC-type phosphate/phosphonate transport system substrate-binding protein